MTTSTSWTVLERGGIGRGMLLLLALLSHSTANAFVPRIIRVHRWYSSYHPLVPNHQFATPPEKGNRPTTTELLEEATTTTTPVQVVAMPSPLVQRHYETYDWKTSLFNGEETISSSYKINYRVQGRITDPPLLLIHGFGANCNHFRYNIPVLAQNNYRVYAVDLLGFGASDKPSVDYCIELFRDLLLDFMKSMTSMSKKEQEEKEKSSSPWIVCGNSIGGLVSLAIAARAPHLVQGIVLFNCSGGMTGFRYEDVPLYIRPLLWCLHRIGLGSYWGPRFFANFKTRQNVQAILMQSGVYRNIVNVNDELLETLLAPSDDDNAQDVFLRVFGGPPGPTPEALLPHISCPILALWGAADPWTPVDKGAHPGNRFDEYAAGEFTLHVLPNVGHCPHDEEPEQCHAFMLPWLKDIQDRYTPPALTRPGNNE